MNLQKTYLPPDGIRIQSIIDDCGITEVIAGFVQVEEVGHVGQKRSALLINGGSEDIATVYRALVGQYGIFKEEKEKEPYPLN